MLFPFYGHVTVDMFKTFLGLNNLTSETEIKVFSLALFDFKNWLTAISKCLFYCHIKHGADCISRSSTVRNNETEVLKMLMSNKKNRVASSQWKQLWGSETIGA
jgi:hypothetical protein